MFLTIIVFFLVLSILVLIHESGHFLAAKKAGIKVEEFGFGLPPRIFGKKIGETIYSLNWLPIGGFVKLYGEDVDETVAVDRSPTAVDGRAFFAKSKRVRAAVLLAGVTMNFLLAVVVISYVFTQGVAVPTNNTYIKGTVKGAPAETAGLKINDIVLKVDGNSIKTPEDLTGYTKKHLGQKINLEVQRCSDAVNVSGCQLIGITLTPRKEYPKDQGAMGIEISNQIEKKYPFWQAPYLGTMEALKISWMMLGAIGGLLLKLITFQPVGQEVSGPIGIAQVTGEAVKFGWMAVLQLLGLLSLNLAVVNVLPFPALDGGRLLFIAIEAVTGKKVHPKYEIKAHQIGMAILLALIILVTINDIMRLFHP